ncbi:MAG: flavodoxin [Dehalococcoidales bacterium]|nr:flavodoxin [Dehalococcoidales bacterium]
METAIIYYSAHHDNTKKLLDAIANQGNVTLIKASDSGQTDLSEYDLIGFASGIYYQKFSDKVLAFAENHLPQGKKVFFIYTCGMKRKGYTDAIQQIASSKGAEMLGEFGCLGYDTFGPFKLVGGIAKGRPNDEDIAGVVKFYEDIRQALRKE